MRHEGLTCLSTPFPRSMLGPIQFTDKAVIWALASWTLNTYDSGRWCRRRVMIWLGASDNAIKHNTVLLANGGRRCRGTVLRRYGVSTGTEPPAVAFAVQPPVVGRRVTSSGR